jgi:hypothetical protein
MVKRSEGATAAGTSKRDMNKIPSSHSGHDSAPLPLVVGVTGHRDLRPEDVPTLEDTVRRAFERIRHDCPDMPIILLTSLAEGADRLVARVGLHAGVRLVPVMPMPELVYLEDFGIRAACLIRSSTIIWSRPSSAGSTSAPAATDRAKASTMAAY